MHVKAECFQRGGAFKFRGAYNKISTLAPGELERGVLAFSSGNHAQAVALASRLLGTTATILMPEDAPAAKVEATRGYGAEIVTYDRWTETARSSARASPRSAGSRSCSPYDDPLVMAGQGTAALELLEQAPRLEVLVAPVGGGGLIAGCGDRRRRRSSPAMHVVGVEPEAGDDTRARSPRASESGSRCRARSPTASRPVGPAS